MKLDIRSPLAIRTMAFVGFVVALQLLPRPTPSGVLLFGFVQGAVTALTAAALVLTYRSSRTINFAQVAFGAGGAMLMFTLSSLVRWPSGLVWLRFPLCLTVGLIVSVVVALVVELTLVRRFFAAPRLVVMVSTIVAAALLPRLTTKIRTLPFIDKDLAKTASRQAGNMDLPFPKFGFQVDPFRFGFAHVFAIFMTVSVLVALAIFLKRSSFGVKIRGAAENSERAQMIGIDVKMVSTVVWGIAGLLGGVASIITGTTLRFGEEGFGPEALVPALAAAVLARMESLPVAVVSAFAISIGRQAVFWSFPKSTFADAVIVAVTLVALVLQRRKAGRPDSNFSASWTATAELQAVPKELSGQADVRRAKTFLRMLALGVVVIFPFAFSLGQTNLASLVAINVIVLLSVVVMTGWGGQVSLGQFAFVAVGAVVSGKLTSSVGMSFWVALPLAATLTAGFAVLVGLPALRIQGSFLAVTTLGFAVALPGLLFNPDYFGWLLPGRIERPRLLVIGFASERAYYALCVAFAVAAALIVKRLRATRPGRIMIALRENEPGVQSFAVNPVRTKLSVFALSGALAGVAGALYAHHQRVVDPAAFGASASVEVFIVAMIGGVTSVSGAVLGAIWVGLLEIVISDPTLKRLGTSGGLLVLLLVAPGGLAGIAYGFRDSVLRLIATRRGIFVPSLFSSTRAEAITSHEAPLAERSPGHGIDALGDRRFDLPSKFHRREVKA